MHVQNLAVQRGSILMLAQAPCRDRVAAAVIGEAALKEGLHVVVQPHAAVSAVRPPRTQARPYCGPVTGAEAPGARVPIVR